MFNSDDIDPKLVRGFKDAYRADLNFSMSRPEKLALAEAFRQLSTEILREAATMVDMPNVDNENRNLQPE